METLGVTRIDASASKALIQMFRRQGNTFLENRQALLESAATAIRLLISPEEDPVFPLLAGGRAIENCTALGLFKDHRERLQKLGVQVVGVHFLDQYAGRVSRIWPIHSWVERDCLPEHVGDKPEYVKFIRGEVDASLECFTYGWVYSHLWMRSYWNMLRTTTTLINAFHEKILEWNNVPLYFCWKQGGLPSLNLKPVVHFADDQHESIRQIAKEFALVIHSHALAEENLEVISSLAARQDVKVFGEPRYRDLIRDISRGVHTDLERRGILYRYRQAAEQLRFATLVSPERRDWYFSALSSMSSDTAQIQGMKELWDEYSAIIGKSNYMKCDVGIWSSKVWINSLWQIEALYSPIMSGYSFAGEPGLWVHRLVNRSGLQAFAVIGFGRHIEAEVSAREIMESLRIDLEVVFDTLVREIDGELERFQKGRGRREGERRSDTQRGGRAVLSGSYVELAQIAGRKGLALDRAIVEKWLQIVICLAEESVHEKKEVQYLLGCGPAYLSRVRSRLFEPAPPQLVDYVGDELTYVEKVVHFLKSYHSLFGDQRRICWFDPLGHFRGIYESADGGAHDHWFVQWDPEGDSSYLIASISGRGRFDLMDRDGAILARFRSGEVRTPTEKDDLVRAVERMARGILRKFSSKVGGTGYLQGVQTFLSRLVSRFQEMAIGTSLVVVLDEEEYEHWPEKFQYKRWDERDRWRLPLESQVRRLAPKLQFYKSWIMETRDIQAVGNDGEKADSIIAPFIDKLLPLAKLDGATILRVREEGITCSPANQLIPLIGWGLREGELRPLDIFDPPMDVERADLPRDVEETDLPEEGSSGKRLSVNQIKTLAELLLGQAQVEVQNDYKALTFLNSSGTRHHSLWGITITAREPIFAFTLSEDGHLRLFCDGRVYLG